MFTHLEAWRKKDTDPYIPSLAIVGTAEKFDQLTRSGVWKIAKEDTTRWDREFSDWLTFFDHVQAGLNIAQRAVKEQKVSGREDDFKAYLYFTRHGLEATPESIASVRRAFAALLSQDMRKSCKIKPRFANASTEDIQNAKTLVQNFKNAIPIRSFFAAMVPHFEPEAE